jgi:hypothetical protein
MHKDMESIDERWSALHGGMRFQLPADVLAVLILQRHKYPDGLFQWVLQGRFSTRLRIYLRIIDDWLTRGMPRSGLCTPGA